MSWTVSQMKVHVACLGLPEHQARALMTAYQRLRALSSEEVIDLFVSEYLSEVNKRHAESLVAFTAHWWLTANISELATDVAKFVAVPLSTPMTFDIIAHKYDARRATRDSSLHVNLKLGPEQVGAQLRATGRNCDRLWRLIPKHLVRGPAPRA
ncbi:MAG: hypothetical protein R6X12_09360 [bacterium]